jgi:uncharacterized protein (DUF305 family)
MRNRPLALAASAAALALLLAACGGSSEAESSGPAPSTGSSTTQTVGEATAADISFAQLMIPHHQQALEMAGMALERAESPGVLELAKQIQAAQDPEIQMMSGWLEAWDAPMEMGDDHGSHDMGGMTMEGMMSDEDMQALMDATGADFDRMWLETMIAHHEGAITMAEQVKAESGNVDVTTLADAVISGQTAEIATMQQLLAQ